MADEVKKDILPGGRLIGTSGKGSDAAAAAANAVQDKMKSTDLGALARAARARPTPAARPTPTATPYIKSTLDEGLGSK